MTFLYMYVCMYVSLYIYPRNNNPRKELRVGAKAVGWESGSSSVFSLVLVSGKIQNL